MCTLIAIKDRHDGAPLIVGANRDEYYARASTPPQLVHETPRAIAGLDLEKGGTWMGANARGIFVALTNQRSYAGSDPRASSRGEVVLDALASDDVEEIDWLLESLDPSDYNGFNLLYGDAATLRVAYARPALADVEIQTLGPGVWVVPNDRIGSPEFPKVERAHELVEPLLEGERAALLDGLGQALGDHVEPGIERIPPPPSDSQLEHAVLKKLQALCVHTPIYGTKSSTLIALGTGRVERYLFADGPPCRSRFEDVTSLLG